MSEGRYEGEAAARRPRDRRGGAPSTYYHPSAGTGQEGGGRPRRAAGSAGGGRGGSREYHEGAAAAASRQNRGPRRGGREPRQEWVGFVEELDPDRGSISCADYGANDGWVLWHLPPVSEFSVGDRVSFEVHCKSGKSWAQNVRRCAGGWESAQPQQPPAPSSGVMAWLQGGGEPDAGYRDPAPPPNVFDLAPREAGHSGCSANLRQRLQYDGRATGAAILEQLRGQEPRPELMLATGGGCGSSGYGGGCGSSGYGLPEAPPGHLGSGAAAAAAAAAGFDYDFGGAGAGSSMDAASAGAARGPLPSKRPLTHRGRVKRADEHYAFLECGELYDKFERDVFVPNKAFGGLTLAVGDIVSFSYKVYKDQPQALEVHRMVDAPSRSPPLIGDGEAAAKEPEDETRFTGSIKSFNPESGYGFVASEEAFDKYGCDVFLHNKQIKEFGVADAVTFAVRLNNQNRPQAFDLRSARSSAWLDGGAPAAVTSTVTTSTPALSSTAPAPVDGEFFEEQQFIGDIKSFNSNKGYGFIHCPELQDRFGRDVFIHQLQFEGKKVGERVAFRVQVRKGQPQAYEVALLSSLITPAVSPMDLFAAGGSASAPGGGGAAAAAAPAAHAGPGRAPHVDAGSAAASTAAAVRMAEAAARQSEKAQAELNTRLARACASVRIEAWDTMRELLAARADANVCDVTGQTPMMIAALNNRHSERKCKLLFEHRADMNAPCSGDMNVVEWARQRINKNFSAFLEAVKNHESPDIEMALEGPQDDF